MNLSDIEHTRIFSTGLATPYIPKDAIGLELAEVCAAY